MERFEEYLKSNLPQVPSFHPVYELALSQMLLAGGKRFRPMLLLSIVDAYEPLLYEGALPVAMSIEMLHTYSLIHDDLPSMDNASLRRGQPTLHVLYDETTAILAGDALNTDAFYILSKAPLRADIKIKLVELLARDGGGRGMVLGQALDCYFENKPLNVEDIKILHTNKTAKLIAASLKMGAIIVGQEELGEKLYDFGIKLGLLFQIQDDILDVTQSSEEAGKLTNNDEDKNSFVTILGLDVAMSEANALADELSNEMSSFDENLRDELSPLLTKYINRHK